MLPEKNRTCRNLSEQNWPSLWCADQLAALAEGQPLTYNKDNQEDKEPLFDTVKTLQDCLRALSVCCPYRPNRTVMRNAALKGFATAAVLQTIS